MVTRGVASVRSPVKNLQEPSPTVTHDKFVRAMVQAFREEYHIEEPVRPVSQGHFFLLIIALGPIRASGGCHRHTVYPRQHGPTPCRNLHIAIVELIGEYFVLRAGIGHLDRLQSSHIRSAGVSDGAAWSVD